MHHGQQDSLPGSTNNLHDHTPPHAWGGTPTPTPNMAAPSLSLRHRAGKDGARQRGGGGVDRKVHPTDFEDTKVPEFARPNLVLVDDDTNAKYTCVTPPPPPPAHRRTRPAAHPAPPRHAPAAHPAMRCPIHPSIHPPPHTHTQHPPPTPTTQHPHSARHTHWRWRR